MIQREGTGPVLRSSLKSFWTAVRTKERPGGGGGALLEMKLISEICAEIAGMR